MRTAMPHVTVWLAEQQTISFEINLPQQQQKTRIHLLLILINTKRKLYAGKIQIKRAKYSHGH